MTLTMNGDDVDVVGGELIVRSNWRGYLDEFKFAVDVWIENGGYVDKLDDVSNAANGDDEWRRAKGRSPAVWKTIGPTQMSRDRIPMTNFEAKFLECGEPIYELSVRKMSKSGSLFYHSEDGVAWGGGQNLG